MSVAPLPARQRPLLVPLALLALYFIWGSTYYAIRLGLGSYPPLLLAATRFLAAGGFLYALLRWRGRAAPSRMQWRNAAISGSLLLGLGNGLVCIAEQHVASGLAAVTVASMPLFAGLFASLHGQWPSRPEWLGLGIGFAGVVLLNLGGSIAGAPLAAVALLVSAAAWAFGSIWGRQRDMAPGAMNTASQMLAGGTILLVVALVAGERWPASPTLVASLAIAWLAIAGSLIAFSAYLYLLQVVRPALATSHAYVNPPVAVLLGTWLGGESLHALDLVAMLVILGGVALIALARERAP